MRTAGTDGHQQDSAQGDCLLFPEFRGLETRRRDTAETLSREIMGDRSLPSPGQERDLGSGRQKGDVYRMFIGGRSRQVSREAPGAGSGHQGRVQDPLAAPERTALPRGGHTPSAAPCSGPASQECSEEKGRAVGSGLRQRRGLAGFLRRGVLCII